MKEEVREDKEEKIEKEGDKEIMMIMKKKWMNKDLEEKEKEDKI